MLSLGRTEKVRQVKGKVKGMLIILFDIKGIVHKQSILAGQIANSAYNCDI
jgi:energy-converting hydrogenase Eha subunit B